ncbi:MAG: hypothetical protein H6648_05100 [Caldilineae bacterium]|nr:hypothetical protein [Caldilineae bacterium]
MPKRTLERRAGRRAPAPGSRRPGLLLLPLFVIAAAHPGIREAGAQDSRAAARVAEASGYTLLYALDIPVTADFHATGPSYRVDASASMDAPFDRVAYYLELEAPDGRLDWVYVSMRAYTAKPTELGLPDPTGGRVVQQPVADLQVASNVAGIQPGDFATGGSLEIWPFNYSPANAGRVPGASDAVYDWGDQPASDGAYGSLQVHQHALGQVLLAYNRWGMGGGVASDIGIGNAVDPEEPGGAHVDWTFRANAGDWAARRLEILVRPGPTPFELKLTAPLAHAVHQRDADGRARVPIQAAGLAEDAGLEARALPLAGQRGRATDWRPIPVGDRPGDVAGQIELEAGWYAVELRLAGDDWVRSVHRVEPVGVGEVFVIAGQSNSANHGQPPLAPADPRVSTFDGRRWRPAFDPQPIATGNGGSPWPALGDLLAERLDLPIGFVSVGWGGTRVDQWLPEAALYPRIADALAGLAPNGARALLWHQGESDAAVGTSAVDYAERLRRVIGASRSEPAAARLPWGVALVSYLPGADPARRAAVIAGQRDVIAAGPAVFEGPDTDALSSADHRWDGIHFNEAGLRAHAAGWATAIAAAFPGLETSPTEPATSEPRPSASATPEASATRAPPATATAARGWLALPWLQARPALGTAPDRLDAIAAASAPTIDRPETPVRWREYQSND